MAVLRRSKGPREYRLRDDRRFKAVNHAVLRKGVCVSPGRGSRTKRTPQSTGEAARRMADNRAFGSRIRPFPSVLRTRFATRATRIAITKHQTIRPRQLMRLTRGISPYSPANFRHSNEALVAKQRAVRRSAVSRCLFPVRHGFSRPLKSLHRVHRFFFPVRAESRGLSAIDGRICGIYGRN